MSDVACCLYMTRAYEAQGEGSPTMMRKLAAVRKLAACGLMIALVTAWPASGVYAQAAPAVAQAAQSQKSQKNQNDQHDQKNQKDQHGPSGQFQAPQPSQYSQQAASVLVAAFDRAMGEIDGMGDAPSPTDVKNATFRRRLLELRLLMDTSSFAYNHDQMKAYRDTIDAAYQAIGDYQDISVVQKLIDGLQVSPDIVNARLNQMNETMGPLRDWDSRTAMRSFFSDPRPNVRSGPGAPRL